MWLVYLVGLLGSVHLLLSIVLVFSTVGVLGLLVDKASPRMVKKTSIALVVAVIGLTILPSERTAYMMLGAYGTQQLLEHPETATSIQKILVIVNQELDSRIKK